jgi:hypothetical protein
MREDHDRPSLVRGIGFEESGILSYWNGDIVEVGGEVSVVVRIVRGTLEGSYSRNEVCQQGSCSQELRVCRDISTLRRGDPVDSLALRIGIARVENSILHGRNTLVWRSTGTFKFRDWQFNIDCANFVGASVFGKAWYGTQSREIGGHDVCLSCAQ